MCVLSKRHFLLSFSSLLLCHSHIPEGVFRIFRNPPSPYNRESYTLSGRFELLLPAFFTSATLGDALGGGVAATLRRAETTSSIKHAALLP